MSKKILYSVFATFLLVLIGGFAFAQNVENEKSTLHVTGKGEVTTKLDTANLTVSVETTAVTASEAVRQNAEKTSRVLDKLKSQVGEDGKISTTGYTLSPIYEYDEKTRKSEVSGYRVTNQVHIETENLKGLGTLIDSATKVGANRIDSLSFSTTEQDEFRRQALAKAVQDAKETGAAVATAAGVSLGKIIQISPSYDMPRPVYQDFAVRAEAAKAAPTPVEPGELTVSAMVNMVFEIQ